MSNQQPQTLAQDLAFTSFPFNAQLVEEAEEQKDSQGGGFRGLFNRLFSDTNQGSSASLATRSENVEVAAVVAESGEEAGKF